MFYIGKRINPQLDKPYFEACGKLTKKEAKEYSKPSYGAMILTSYSCEKDYLKAIEDIKNQGYRFI